MFQVINPRSDENLVPILHRLRGATFFTLDEDFYDYQLCHARFCLVWLDMDAKFSAQFIRRFLKHPIFDWEVKRMGKVVRVRPGGIEYREVRKRSAQALSWRSLLPFFLWSVLLHCMANNSATA